MSRTALSPEAYDAETPRWEEAMCEVRVNLGGQRGSYLCYGIDLDHTRDYENFRHLMGWIIDPLIRQALSDKSDHAWTEARRSLMRNYIRVRVIAGIYEQSCQFDGADWDRRGEDSYRRFRSAVAAVKELCRHARRIRLDGWWLTRAQYERDVLGRSQCGGQEQ